MNDSINYQRSANKTFFFKCNFIVIGIYLCICYSCKKDAKEPPCTNGETDVVDVLNPITGKIWMDRNLGATQVAASLTDKSAYGDLYQWGRGTDGHQCRNSATRRGRSSTDQPGHGDFIYTGYTDWRNPSNDSLWQGINGVNNPCPNGYRVPTKAEWEEERLSWINNNADGAFASPLKLSLPGYRGFLDGSLVGVKERGMYWCSEPGYVLGITNNSGSEVFTLNRASAVCVRCIKD